MYMQYTEEHAFWLSIAVISIRQFLFTNYDIITYFINLTSCSEHCISIKHQILATFNI
jgi:hypothetical protein